MLHQSFHIYLFSTFHNFYHLNLQKHFNYLNNFKLVQDLTYLDIVQVHLIILVFFKLSFYVQHFFLIELLIIYKIEPIFIIMILFWLQEYQLYLTLPIAVHFYFIFFIYGFYFFKIVLIFVYFVNEDAQLHDLIYLYENMKYLFDNISTISYLPFSDYYILLQILLILI